MSVNIADTLGRIGKGFWLLFAKDAGLNDGRDVQTAITEIEAIAKGRSKGYVFDTKADLDTALADPDFTKDLLLGDNLYIRATDVPDFWWDGSAAQQLETQKVDLSEYTKTVDLPKDLADFNDDADHRLVSDTQISKWDQGGSAWTGTHDDYDVLEEPLPPGTHVVFTDDEDPTGNNNRYSTRETVIGTYIDGKPIYRKVVSVQADATYTDGTSKDTAFNLEALGVKNPDVFIKTIGVVKSLNKVLPYISANSQCITIINNPKNALILRCNASMFNGVSIDAVLEYTKTTD